MAGTTFRECFKAPAKREREFCARFGKPRLHVERYLRELHHFKTMSPATHIGLLDDYLQLAPLLDIPPNHRLARPVLCHPDLSPNNILVDSSSNIVGIIDWQHAVALPLCLCAGIPDHFQNWGDAQSETLQKPEVTLPENFHSLSQDEQEDVKETMRRRLVHFYYAALTMRQMPDRFDAFRNENAMLRAKFFNRAGAPWEGDSLSLKYTMLQVCQNWPLSLDFEAPPEFVDCPVKFSEEEACQCTHQYEQEQEKLRELAEMKDLIGVDALGWVPAGEQLKGQELSFKRSKQGCLSILRRNSSGAPCRNISRLTIMMRTISRPANTFFMVSWRNMACSLYIRR